MRIIAVCEGVALVVGTTLLSFVWGWQAGVGVGLLAYYNKAVHPSG